MVNCLKHAIPIGEHIVVPEAKDPPSFRDQESIAFEVTGTVGMLATVEFDDEPLLDRGKVCNVRPDWHLSAEFCATQPAISQQKPYRALCVRRVAPQFARYVSLLSVAHPLTRPRSAPGTLSRKRERDSVPLSLAME
jgi:hypothetical protein